MHMNGYVSKSAFAKIYGCGLSYVTKLKSLNRLVLSEDGKMVNVEASLKLIESTGDPSKQGVRERWDAYRNGQSLDDLPCDIEAEKPSAPSGKRSPAGGDGATSEYHKARTQKEQIDAQLKLIELRKLQGQVAEVAPMAKAMFDSQAAAQAAILQLPDRLTQLVAPETDPVKVHDILRKEAERICESMVREIQRLREQHQVEVAA